MSNTIQKNHRLAARLGEVANALLVTFGLYILATGTGLVECVALVGACLLAALYVGVTR